MRRLTALVLLSIVPVACSTIGVPQGAGREPTPAESDSTPRQAATTGSGKAGESTLEFRLGYYNNEDNGDGNPFLDEELTVIEPVLIFDTNLTDRTALWGKFSYDLVSSASIDRLSKFPEQSGASGDYYFGLEGGVRHELDETSRIGAFASGSIEYDYASIGLGFDYARDLAQKNTTLKFSLNGFFDKLDVIRFNGVQEGTDDRVSVSATGNWYQVLSAQAHGELGVTVTQQSGFLETPYNAIVREDPALPPNSNLDNLARGVEVAEELPNDRTRFAVFGRARQAISERTAAELGGRLYTDTWGINSIALEPRLFFWLTTDRLSARLRYRYYVQSEADYYQDQFTTVERYRTQDSDLADFDSHTVGLRFDYYWTDSLRLDIGGDYVLRSDGLDQILGSIGLKWTF